jgi:hypothetical protein
MPPAFNLSAETAFSQIKPALYSLPNLVTTRKKLFMRLFASYYSAHVLVFFKLIKHSTLLKNASSRAASLYFVSNTNKSFPLPVRLN